MVKGVIGVFSRFEIPENTEFYHVSTLLGCNELHIDELFKRFISIGAGYNTNLMQTLYRYMAFDYLIGQEDRHLNNLAILKMGKNINLYKLYDNGLALSSYLSNNIAIERLKHDFFNSRVGSSKDITNALHKYSGIISSRINLNSINFDIIYKIIEDCDRYKEIVKNGKVEMAKFVCKQAENLRYMWGM